MLTVRLYPYGTHSYTLDGPHDDFVSWLRANRFDLYLTNNPREYRRARLRGTFGRALLVLYATGTVLLQGPEDVIAQMRDVLAPLITEPQALAEQTPLWQEVQA